MTFHCRRLKVPARRSKYRFKNLKNPVEMRRTTVHDFAHSKYPEKRVPVLGLLRL
jgi:hypothetical protein